jgi:hypothetical protein
MPVHTIFCHTPPLIRARSTSPWHDSRGAFIRTIGLVVWQRTALDNALGPGTIVVASITAHRLMAYLLAMLICVHAAYPADESDSQGIQNQTPLTSASDRSRPRQPGPFLRALRPKAALRFCKRRPGPERMRAIRATRLAQYGNLIATPMN